MKRLHPSSLAVAIALGLTLAGAVIAQSRAPTSAQQKELDAARADLDAAAKRYSDLSRKYGEDVAYNIRINQQALRKPVIGVLLARSGDAGVRIAGVTPGSGAEQAGLKSGDVITAIGGETLAADQGSRRYDDAVALLADIREGQPVAIDYLRGGKTAQALVTPKLDQRVFMLHDGMLSKFEGNVSITQGELGEFAVMADRVEMDDAVMQGNVSMTSAARPMPHLNREITRIVECKGADKDCAFPMLTEAFRWSGLNLAALDPHLGRYFGTDDGVLVLSTGGELAGLQPGDVVQKIDGKRVDSPREAMTALRAKPAESRVRVDYLRDRKSATAQVTVPKATPFRVPAPPAPPVPPDPPISPAAPAAPDAPQVVERRKIVMVDDNGKTMTWEGDGNDPLPEWAKDAPAPPAPPKPPAAPPPPPAPPAPDGD